MLGASVDCVSFPCKSIQMTIFFNVSIFNVADLLCRILPIAFFQHPLCTTVERIQSFKLYRWIISWWQVTNFEIALSRVIWFALLPRHIFFFYGPLGFKLCREKLFRDSAFAVEMVCNPKEKDLFCCELWDLVLSHHFETGSISCKRNHAWRYIFFFS